MRVIGGAARGRRLKAPRGRTARPTADRVREALFSSLADEVPGAVVLDLFAGTGALGIEALSRGAAHATFVENSATVARVLDDNLRTTDLADRARVVRRDAAAFVRGTQPVSFTLVFCDPPYDVPTETILRLLAVLDSSGGLARPAAVVIERDRHGSAAVALSELAGVLVTDRQRSYGDTVLLYLRTPGDH